jgi:alpha-beta hydrolase superfamily lysophospholipase
MAGEALGRVQAPTLLLVGERDFGVVDLNQQALIRLGSQEKELRLVPRATHLFAEPGALEEVARHAGDWFERHLII